MTEPIQNVRFIPNTTPLAYDVEIQLAAHIPSCCGVSDGAAAEFHADGFYQRLELTLEEHREGHLLKGSITFPKSGVYGYRFTGRILGQPFFREGTCDAS